MKKNEKKDAAPGAPIAWESPSQPEEVQPGYGYVADNNESEETFYYHGDHLGSTSYVTDDSARITQYTAYLPYGELLVDEHSSSEDMPYKFNGKELDEETSLYYYGARYMQPITSVWYGIDPLTEKYPDVSAYVYCAGNPVKYIDPDGNVLETIWDVGNIVWDVGSAIYYHINGEHDEAKSSWCDAGLDVVATCIPFVPAGSSKLYKAIKGASKVETVIKESKVAAKTASKVESVAKETTKQTRRSAFRQAKRDAGIPMSQHPKEITYKSLENKGKQMRDKYGMPINSREYHFDGAKGEAIIQEHSLGHPQFDGEAAKPHFNVRSTDKPRTGTYPNTKGHYVFSKKNK